MTAHPVLLVEDDPGDALLVQELLSETDEYDCRSVGSLSMAMQRIDPSVRCVLLDLGLPDANGLDGLRQMIAAAAGAAVIVLTGFGDQRLGAEAVATGAQDYLVKGTVDATSLGRAIRYAIERKRSEETARLLREAELLGAEKARLERGLLPKPLIPNGGDLHWLTRYRPGGRRTLLGGDFFDGIELDDGTLRIVVGDVAGHGPDEAAVGVALRVGWRALVLGETQPADMLPRLQRVLDTERDGDHVFATVCDLTVAPDRRRAQVRLAGHPAPLLVRGTHVEQIVADHGPALGLTSESTWAATHVQLGDRWGLLLFTDGIIEGRAEDGRLDDEGLIRLAQKQVHGPAGLEELADDLIAGVEEANGGPLHDDVALFLLCRGTPWCS